MGTFYKLVDEKDTITEGEFGIDEMSNKLALVFCESVDFHTDAGQLWKATKEMPPEEMAKIMLKGLTVCSYWMDTNELKALIKDHMNKEIY